MALKNAFGDIALDASIKELLQQLVRLFRATVKPPWWAPASNRLMATTLIESGTVTTVTGITNFGGYAAQLPTLYTSRTAWQLGCRNRIT